MDEIVRRLDNHEIKDETRFDTIHQNQVAMRAAQAKIDGKLELIHKLSIENSTKMDAVKNQWKVVGYTVGAIVGGAWAVLNWYYGG